MSPKDVVLPDAVNDAIKQDLRHMSSTLVPVMGMPCVDYANFAVYISAGLAPLFTKVNTMTYVARVRVANVEYFVTKAAAQAPSVEEERGVIQAYVGRAAATALENFFGNEYVGTELVTVYERAEAARAKSGPLTVAIGVDVDLKSVKEAPLARDNADSAPTCWEVMATVDIPVSEEVWAAAMDALQVQVNRVMVVNMEAAQNLTAAEATATMLLSRVADAAAGDSNPTH